MIWEPRDIAWSPQVEQDLRRLQPQVADRVTRAIERYALTGIGDAVRLQGIAGEFRLRVREWRVRFADDPEHHRLIILRVLPRGRAYER